MLDQGINVNIPCELLLFLFLFEENFPLFLNKSVTFKGWASFVSLTNQSKSIAKAFQEISKEYS